jgi:hypothetical protein
MLLHSLYPDESLQKLKDAQDPELLDISGFEDIIALMMRAFPTCRTYLCGAEKPRHAWFLGIANSQGPMRNTM